MKCEIWVQKLIYFNLYLDESPLSVKPPKVLLTLHLFHVDSSTPLKMKYPYDPYNLLHPYFTLPCCLTVCYNLWTAAKQYALFSLYGLIEQATTLIFPAAHLCIKLAHFCIRKQPVSTCKSICA